MFFRVIQSKFSEAEPLFSQAIMIRERWFGKSHVLVAEILNDLGGLQSSPNYQQLV